MLKVGNRLALAFGLMFSEPSMAQSVVPCEGVIDISMITEPWELYSRAYAEGAIRIFEALVAPTMAAGAAIGVIHPVPGDPYPMRTCTAVLYEEQGSRYFVEAVISETRSSYDPAKGLTLRVPVRFPDGRQPIEAVEIIVNQATGSVTAR